MTTVAWALSAALLALLIYLLPQNGSDKTTTRR